METKHIERIQESWTEFLGWSLSTLGFGLCILVRVFVHACIEGATMPTSNL